MLKIFKKAVVTADRNRKLMKSINNTIYDSDIAVTYPLVEDRFLSAQKTAQMIDACRKAQRYLDEAMLEAYCDKIKTSYYPVNCSNCGAPMHSNKCEYCNTEYNQQYRKESTHEKSESSLQFLQPNGDYPYELLS